MAGAIDARLSDLASILPDCRRPGGQLRAHSVRDRKPALHFRADPAEGRRESSTRASSATGSRVEDGQGRRAGLCAINLIAQMRAAWTASLDRVSPKVVKLVRLSSTPPNGFGGPAKRGQRRLRPEWLEVFGDKGRHARSAVGVAGLPFGVAWGSRRSSEVD